MRRAVIAVGLITVVALAALAALGGAFQLQPTNDSGPSSGSWPVTARLPDPVPGGHGWSVPAQSNTAPGLVLHFVAAGSNEPITAYKHVTIRDSMSQIVDVKSGQGPSLVVTPPAGMPFTVHVDARGWLPGMFGPFVHLPGVAQAILIELSKVQPVTFASGGGFVGRRLTIQAAGPPDDARPRPQRDSEVLTEGKATFDLAPGDYWCFIHHNYGSRAIAGLFPDPVDLFPLTVGDEPATVDLSALPVAPTRPLSGRVTDEDGKPAARAEVMVDVLAPCGISWRAATLTADAEGRFHADKLPDALLRVHVDCGAGKAEAVTTPGHTDKPVLLQLRPWMSKSRGVFPVEPVGSVQILKRGKPVPGAQLFIEGFGTLLTAWTDGRNYTIGDKANEQGVVTNLGRDTGVSLVNTRFPKCADPFELRVRPGSSARAVLELAPPGTGTLRVLTTWDPGALRGWRLTSKGRGHDFPIGMGAHESGVLEVCGLTPGSYTLSARDDRWLDHSIEVILRADEETVLEEPIKRRGLSCKWPYEGFWDKSAELRIAQADNFDNQTTKAWEPLLDTDPSWKAGPAIGQTATFAICLLAYREGQLVAAAYVPAGTQDVTTVQWQLFGNPEDALVSLSFRAPSRMANLGSLSVSVGTGIIESLPMSARRFPDKDGIVFRTRLRPGVYRLVVSSPLDALNQPFFESLDTTVEVKAGSPIEINLKAVPEPPVKEFKPSRQVLQPAPKEPLARPVGPDELFPNKRASMEFHVDVADLPALWHATLVLPARHAHWNAMVGEVLRTKPLQLRQRQGRPILCFDGELRQGDELTLRVPGFAPVQVLWPGGDCVAVSLKR